MSAAFSVLIPWIAVKVAIVPVCANRSYRQYTGHQPHWSGIIPKLVQVLRIPDIVPSDITVTLPEICTIEPGLLETPTVNVLHGRR